MAGRLNLFQAAMLRWRELAPYNAVHVLRIAAPFDPPRLVQAIDGIRAACGLFGFELDARARRYRYSGAGIGSPLALLTRAGDGAETLRAAIERELNAAFPASGVYEPFRFFAVADADGTAFRLGLAYDHLVAGGDSIAALLAGIAERYRNDAAPTLAPSQLYPPTFRRLFVAHAGALIAGMAQLPRISASCRRGYRPRYAESEDGHNGVAQIRIAPAEFTMMARAAKSWDVTVNDLLMALLLRNLSPWTAERRGEARRTELAVASIVNIRRDYQPGVRAVFGQFLSSFRVSHRVPEGVGLAALARDVHAQTDRIKRRKLYLQTLLGIAVGGLIWRWQSRRQRSRFHAKSYPVWAGVTLLDVDAIWRGDGSAVPGDPAPEYLRAVSTGPLAPLVVAATIAGGALTLGISYRTTAFTRERIDELAAALVRELAELPR